MKRLSLVSGISICALLSLAAGAAMAQAKKPVIGVSWANFQEERWKIDEGAIKARLAELGADYVATDAQSSPTKQLADVEGLLARGVTALIINAWDSEAIRPAVAKAKAEGVPVVGYDRLIEMPEAFYITFDNKEVGRMQAREVFKLAPKGNYIFIKGASTDPNADILYAGQLEVLKPAMDKGDVKSIGDQYTDKWLPENAQRNTEQMLTRANNNVAAVVASNDGTAGGAVAALTAQGLQGIPVSGQDGDKAALNRVARGLQTVSVWKDARALGKRSAEIAVDLSKGTAPDKIAGAAKWAEGAKKVPMDAILLTPVPITRDNLDVVIAAGWVTKDVVCQGVEAAKAPAACK
ncbi:MAG: D-xylose ABC transporter substrate-binding protein [Alphaproteobacteria bacterium]|jgi:D-xylose transport system substrate-binding protein|nr:D-xylose ABC transporter substrate-binding protein [Alphaproteobacteria bacterium]